MARKRKHSKKARRHAGSHARRTNPGTMRRHSRRRNPGGGTFGTPKDWLFGGVGVIVGSVGSRALPQAIMPNSNTGAMGYFLNAASTGVLALLSHMVFKTNKVLTGSIIAGGAGSLLSRIIGDYSLLGSYSAAIAGQAGLGDYQFQDFLTPQRLTNGLRSSAIAQPGWAAQPAPMAVQTGHSAAAAGGVGSLYGGSPYRS